MIILTKSHINGNIKDCELYLEGFTVAESSKLRNNNKLLRKIALYKQKRPE